LLFLFELIILLSLTILGTKTCYQIQILAMLSLSNKCVKTYRVATLYSPKPSPLDFNNTALSNTALSNTALSNTALSDNTLSDYQKATLQAMGIVLYELREATAVVNAVGAVESVDVVEAANAVESSSDSIAEHKLIDEADVFIKQIFAIFNVSSSAELGFTWQVQDSKTIILEDNILITPDAKTLRTARFKKQLWETLQVFFKSQEWS